MITRKIFLPTCTINPISALTCLRKPEVIRIKASARQSDNLRSLPLHNSQKEIELLENGETIFEYRLVPSSTFIGEIMMMQGSVEVLEPASLRQRIHELAQELANIHR